MMLYLLARTKARHEFATADAINDLGAVAVVPRKVFTTPPKDGKPANYDFRPLIPGAMFLAIDPITWHRIKSNQKGYTLHDAQGRKLRAPTMIEDILPRTWSGGRDGGVQGFAERAEMEAQRQVDRFEAGLKVVRYKAGDKLRIVGDLIHGQLRDHFARFVRIDDKGRIEAVVDGLEMMGKPVHVRLQAHDVDGIAAE